TQSTIERHLLTVGSSLYQDPEFKKGHPDYSPISRFGIGVLSTFMIADSVEITTCHPREEFARKLSLRSVQGRYLVRLINKDSPEIAELLPHGTRVSLTVRPSASVEDVLDTARKWIVVPGCDVTVSVDGSEPVKVGFKTPGEYLVKNLEAQGIRVTAEAGKS